MVIYGINERVISPDPEPRKRIEGDKSMEEFEKTPLHTERRRYPRFELSQALAYQWGPTKGTLRTVDVSLGGIKIQIDSPIPVDERVDLILLLEFEAIKPVGKIVWSNPSSYQKYDVGICFETISHQSLKRLERFLNGIPLRDKLGNREKDLDQSGLRGLESKSFELGRLRANFLRWLQRSYPWEYKRYADWPEIGENEIKDFLGSKGIDQVNIHYLLKSLSGG